MYLALVLRRLGACSRAVAFSEDFDEDWDAALDANNSPYWLLWLCHYLSYRRNFSIVDAVQAVAKYGKDLAISGGQPLALIDTFDKQALARTFDTNERSVQSLHAVKEAYDPTSPEFAFSSAAYYLHSALVYKDWTRLGFAVSDLISADIRTAKDQSLSQTKRAVRARVRLTHAIRAELGERLLEVLYRAASDMVRP